jgi:hypothetical protein
MERTFSWKLTRPPRTMSRARGVPKLSRDETTHDHVEGAVLFQRLLPGPVRGDGSPPPSADIRCETRVP